MTRPIKRGIPWPTSREETKKVGPYPAWEQFRLTTLTKHFPDSQLSIDSGDSELLKEFYIARRLYQKNDPKAASVMAEWQARVDKEKGENFYSKYGKVLRAIRDETTSVSIGRERKRI